MLKTIANLTTILYSTRVPNVSIGKSVEDTYEIRQRMHCSDVVVSILDLTHPELSLLDFSIIHRGETKYILGDIACNATRMQYVDIHLLRDVPTDFHCSGSLTGKTRATDISEDFHEILGDWTLRIEDTDDHRGGIFHSWSMKFVDCSPSEEDVLVMSDAVIIILGVVGIFILIPILVFLSLRYYSHFITLP